MSYTETLRTPLREHASEALGRIELHRAELFDLFNSHLESRSFDGFRSAVESRWKAWRDSPTSLLLVGISFFQQGDQERAREFVEGAERIWSDLADFGMLDRVTIELVRSSLACCRAKSLEAGGDSEEARLLLEARIRTVVSDPKLRETEREEVIRKPLQLLKSRPGLTPKAITELAQI